MDHKRSFLRSMSGVMVKLAAAVLTPAERPSLIGSISVSVDGCGATSRRSGLAEANHPGPAAASFCKCTSAIQAPIGHLQKYTSNCIHFEEGNFLTLISIGR